jgi:hypothetical protein
MPFSSGALRLRRPWPSLELRRPVHQHAHATASALGLSSPASKRVIPFPPQLVLEVGRGRQHESATTRNEHSARAGALAAWASTWSAGSPAAEGALQFSNPPHRLPRADSDGSLTPARGRQRRGRREDAEEASALASVGSDIHQYPRSQVSPRRGRPEASEDARAWPAQERRECAVRGPRARPASEPLRGGRRLGRLSKGGRWRLECAREGRVPKNAVREGGKGAEECSGRARALMKRMPCEGPEE